jgi:formate C-acetyltransferase
MAEPLALLKVQRTCVYDGPGIRTTLFFRGCNLRCLWCQNPESQTFIPDPRSEPTYSVENLLELVLRDREYYLSTGGGVTLSGGEPLLQSPPRLIPFLKALRDEGVHIAAETSLHVPKGHLTALAPYIDLFLVDLKLVGDDHLHKACTGQNDRLIHSNLLYLSEMNAKIAFRMVMVPGHNDSRKNIEDAAGFLHSVGHSSIELLKLHSLYEDKARRLGVTCKDLGISNDQAVSSIRNAIAQFTQAGIVAVCHEVNSQRRTAVFSPRVHAIQEAIRGSERHLCFEASRLKTEYYKRHGFKAPAPVHRAQRLAHVLQNKKTIVYPNELLVGNFTSKRRGAQVWEEHSGAAIALVLHQLHRQKPVAFQCSWKDRIDFYRNIAPFWLRHSLITKVYKSFSGFSKLIARYSEMNTGFNNNLASIAHYVVNYERLLAHGTTGLIAEAEEKKASMPSDRGAIYDGMIISLKALETFSARYAECLSQLSRSEADSKRCRELEDMAAICRHVPKYPARTYHEALQSMMFLQIALCIESFENAISPGRLDQILYPYYRRDQQAGLINFEQARELLTLFILKMDEAIFVNDGNTYFGIGKLFETLSTDQTVTAGGLTKDGRDATNELTYALLDICELQPYAVNMTARIHPNSPQEFVDRLAEVYINGSPMPALYNDEIYLETLQSHYDTTLEQARNYAIVGCVEPNASDDHFGNTDCANMNVVLPFLQALRGDESDLWDLGLPDQIEKIATKAVDRNFSREGRVSGLISSAYHTSRDLYLAMVSAPVSPPADMEELLSRFQKRLNCLATAILSDHQKIEAVIRKDFPTPLASTLFKGCVDRGMDVNEGGATLNSAGIQAVGITDVADSLHAIDEVVYRQGRYSIRDVITAIEQDFEGEGNRRIREALLEVPKFGQDDSKAATHWVNRTLQIYVDALRQVPNCPRNGIYVAGYYALNVSDVYGKGTPSLPSGRLKGVPLANSVAPHYGMQSADLLSSLNSVAGVDFAKYAPNGTTVTFTIDAALFQGPDGVGKLSGIFRTFFKKGGMQFQPNVINREILLDAYAHPDKYPNLLVRVAGYCAYFNDLSDDLKQIIIHRTCYG